MTPEFKDVQLVGVRTVSSMPKAKPPATLMEIKAGLIGSIRAAARKIDKLLQTGYKPSHTWLSVRTDSKRHVLKFVVSGSDEHLRHAHDLAKVVEQWISEEYSQQVPVEVSEPPRYEVTSNGNSVSIYRGQAVPSQIDQGHEFF
jgi:hypothetical protein